MDYFHDKKIRAMLVEMANEDPNEFIRRLYHTGLDHDELEEHKYLLKISRRTFGYDENRDEFLKQGIA